MATINPTYSITDEFDVAGYLPDNNSLHETHTLQAVEPSWLAGYTDFNVAGGRATSAMTIASATLQMFSVVPGDRTMLDSTVEVQLSTPPAGFSSLRLAAFDAGLTEISPTLQINSGGTVNWGFEDDLQTMTPTSASSHILKMVMTGAAVVEFYVDGVLVGSQSRAGVSWAAQVLLDIRNTAWMEYVHWSGTDIVTVPDTDFWTAFLGAHETP